jgi:mitotic spindle assembly checkpoint protein MAD1
LAFRASRSIDADSSGTPVSLTQTLVDLRLTRARLLEEHGTTVSLLRQREVQLTDLEQRESQAQGNILSLQEELLAGGEGITCRETRAVLAD